MYLSSFKRASVVTPAEHLPRATDETLLLDMVQSTFIGP
jgi:hypothetical protein